MGDLQKIRRSSCRWPVPELFGRSCGRRVADSGEDDALVQVDTVVSDVTGRVSFHTQSMRQRVLIIETRRQMWQKNHLHDSTL
jgi:hypothetical protein